MLSELSDVLFLRRYYITKMSNKFWTLLVWRLPKPLIRWATVRAIVHATSGEYSNTVVPDVTAMDTLKRWD